MVCADCKTKNEKPCACGAFCVHTVPDDTNAEHHCDDCCRPNWTRGTDGTLFTSDRYLAMREEVAKMIEQNDGGNLDRNWVRATAGLILSTLAYKHGFAPTKKGA